MNRELKAWERPLYALAMVAVSLPIAVVVVSCFAAAALMVMFTPGLIAGDEDEGVGDG